MCAFAVGNHSNCLCSYSQCERAEIETGLSYGRAGSAKGSQTAPNTNGNFVNDSYTVDILCMPSLRASCQQLVVFLTSIRTCTGGGCGQTARHVQADGGPVHTTSICEEGMLLCHPHKLACECSCMMSLSCCLLCSRRRHPPQFGPLHPSLHLWWTWRDGRSCRQGLTSTGRKEMRMKSETRKERFGWMSEGCLYE